MKKNIPYFIAGIVITATLWWFTEKMLDRHIGPRLGQ